MDENTKAIVERLDRLTNLVAIGLLGGKTQREQIRLLSKGGFPPREIAELVGTTPNTVRVELTSIRKDKKKRNRN